MFLYCSLDLARDVNRMMKVLQNSALPNKISPSITGITPVLPNNAVKIAVKFGALELSSTGDSQAPESDRVDVKRLRYCRKVSFSR